MLASDLQVGLLTEVARVAKDQNHDNVSDISGDEDFNNQHENASGDQKKKPRVVWTPQKEEYLLRCVNHMRIHCYSAHGLKGRSWHRIAYRMTQEFNEEYDSKTCRNKYNVLRYEYLAYLAVVQIKQTIPEGKDQEAALAALYEKNLRAPKWKDAVFAHVDLYHRIIDMNGEGVELVPELDYLQEQSRSPPQTMRERGERGQGAAPLTGRKRPRTIVAAVSGGPSNHVNDGQQHSQGRVISSVIMPLSALPAALPATNPARQQQGQGQPQGGYINPNHMPPPSSQQQQSQRVYTAAEVDELMGRLLERVNRGFDDLVDNLRSGRLLLPIQSQSAVAVDQQQFLSKVQEELSSARYLSLMSSSQTRDRILSAFIQQPSIAQEFFLCPEAYRLSFLEDMLLNKGQTSGRTSGQQGRAAPAAAGY